MEEVEDRLSVGGDARTPEPPEVLTDDELTSLALAADLDEPLDANAVPMDTYLASNVTSLPEWYMAPVRARCSGRFGRAVILAIVCSFLLIEAFGLCSTYGQLPFH
jgi:hypothetical protein